jgi:hypothetical protein
MLALFGNLSGARMGEGASKERGSRGAMEHREAMVGISSDIE